MLPRIIELPLDTSQAGKEALYVQYIFYRGEIFHFYQGTKTNKWINTDFQLDQMDALKTSNAASAASGSSTNPNQQTQKTKLPDNIYKIVQKVKTHFGKNTADTQAIVSSSWIDATDKAELKTYCADKAKKGDVSNSFNITKTTFANYTSDLRSINKSGAFVSLLLR